MIGPAVGLLENGVMRNRDRASGRRDSALPPRPDWAGSQSAAPNPAQASGPEQKSTDGSRLRACNGLQVSRSRGRARVPALAALPDGYWCRGRSGLHGLCIKSRRFPFAGEGYLGSLDDA